MRLKRVANRRTSAMAATSVSRHAKEYEVVKHVFVNWNVVSCEQLLTSGIPSKVEFRRISLTGFRSCASRSQTGASQSRQSTE
ncbi:hypothetical protein Tco_1158460 [Tanacetum coccineum]